MKRETYQLSVKEERRKINLSLQRIEGIEAQILKSFPNDIEATYSFDVSLHSILRIWLNLKPVWNEEKKKYESASVNDTVKANMWGDFFFNMKGQKGIRKDSGSIYFSYKLEKEDKFGKYDFWLMIENSNQLTCRIEKVTKEVEEFEIKCS